jgi:hypothetical protein
MRNAYPYWGVYPNFLKIGKFTVAKRDEARQWCFEHCENKFISSDLNPWAFLDKQDAIKFQKQYGGTIRFKDAEE